MSGNRDNDEWLDDSLYRLWADGEVEMLPRLLMERAGSTAVRLGNECYIIGDGVLGFLLVW
jgi:hypothetical protein